MCVDALPTNRPRRLRLPEQARIPWFQRFPAHCSCISAQLHGYSQGFVINVSSHDRVTITGRITTSNVVFELTLDIVQKSRCADSEQFRFEPLSSKFFLQQDQPFQSLFRMANPARRLESDTIAGSL